MLVIVSTAVSDVLPHLYIDEMDHVFLSNRVKKSGVFLFSAKELLLAMTKTTKLVDKRVLRSKGKGGDTPARRIRQQLYV